MMRGWTLAGIRRRPGPLIGTVVAAATAAALTVAAVSIAAADTASPAGRLAGASVVVAGDTNLHVIVGHGEDARQSLPLAAYRGVPATLAGQLAHVPGVASAAGQSGFPGGVVRPGQVDLIAVKARPGVSPDVLAQRIRAALHGGRGYTIATGAARGDVANLDAPLERVNGQALGGALIPPIVLISLFVLATTAALAVNLRSRRFALLRTIGASRGQVRRAVLAELACCGLAGGALGWLPGLALGTLGVRALAAHQMLPATSAAWLSPWLALIACGIAAIVTALSGQVAARRAGRTPPAQALRETAAERTWPHPVRILLGLAAAGGAGTLMVVTVGEKSPAGQLALALPLLLACLLAVALLGPVLVAAAAWLARPARAIGPSARLALAAISAQPRRTASAVIPVALAAGLVGSVYFADASIAHATAGQAVSTLRAGHVIAGTGLTDAALRQARALPGVRAAAGVAPVTLAATDPDLEQVHGEAVAGEPGRVLDLGVTSGRLTALRPGQIAVSSLEAAPGAMGVHVGSRITVYLPDGTPYRATVSAVYARALASGDVLIPAAVTAGHTGAPPGFAQILVSGGAPGALAGLTAGHPGWRVTSRGVANAQAEQATAQNAFGSNLILGVVAALAAVSLVTTLAVATVERRRVVRLLGRVGATRRQVAAVFGWHALFVIVTGLVAGVAAGAVTLLAVTRAATGSWVPFVPFVPAAAIVAAVAVLTAGGVLVPFLAMSRPGQAARALPLGADRVPQAAVEVELVAAGLARAAVADIGIQRMAVVGGLQPAVRSPDHAELAGHARAGLDIAADRRPVHRAFSGAPGGGRGVRDKPVQGQSPRVGQNGDAADRGGLQGHPGGGRGRRRAARVGLGHAEQGQGGHRDGADPADRPGHGRLHPPHHQGAPADQPLGRAGRADGDRGQGQDAERRHLDQPGGDPCPGADFPEPEQPDPHGQQVGAERGQREPGARGRGQPAVRHQHRGRQHERHHDLEQEQPADGGDGFVAGQVEPEVDGGGHGKQQRPRDLQP
jgi:putative ABC transport system permease protein